MPLPDIAPLKKDLKKPAVKPVLPDNQPAPKTSGIDYNSNPLYLKPGESIKDYNTRTAPSLVDSSGQGTGVVTSPPPAPSPTGYNPTGTPGAGTSFLAAAAGGSAPSLPSMADIIKSSHIPTLQAALSDVQNQKMKLTNDFNAYKLSLQGKGTAAGIVNVMTDETAKSFQIQMDSLNQQEANASSLLNNATTYTGMLMQASGQDYQTAYQSYSDNFSRALAVQQLINTQANTNQNNASAYLNTVGNLIGTTGISWDKVSPTMQASIKNMEVAAGWAPGTLQAFAKAKPGVNILQTVAGVDKNGQNAVTFVYANPDGTPGMMQTVETGTYKQTPLQMALQHMGLSQKRVSIARSEQIIETSKAREAVVLLGTNITNNPILKTYSAAMAFKPEFDAAVNSMNTEGVNAGNVKSLLDSSTKIMTGGNQITEGQISLSKDYLSYQSQFNVLKQKLYGQGGAIDAKTAKQIADIVNASIKTYGKSVQQIKLAADDTLRNAPSGDLSGYNPLKTLGALPSILDGSYQKSLEQTSNAGGGTIDLSGLDPSQIQSLQDQGIIQ